jgi:hypothetical protein
MSEIKTNEWPELDDHLALHRVAKMVGMSWAEWRAIEPRLPRWTECMSILLGLISNSAKSPTVLFCFDDTVVLRHDGHLAASSSLVCAGDERIKGKNEVVDPSANLTCEKVRSIFVMLEALVYKIVHIELEQQRPNYSQRAETYEARLDRLVTHGMLDAAMRILALELYETRNQFAHSLLSVEKISYLSEPLQDRWGSTDEYRHRPFKRYFLPDVYIFSEVLLTRFRPIQGRQLDPARFRAAFADEQASWAA